MRHSLRTSQKCIREHPQASRIHVAPNDPVQQVPSFPVKRWNQLTMCRLPLSLEAFTVLYLSYSPFLIGTSIHAGRILPDVAARTENRFFRFERKGVGRAPTPKRQFTLRASPSPACIVGSNWLSDASGTSVFVMQRFALGRPAPLRTFSTLVTTQNSQRSPILWKDDGTTRERATSRSYSPRTER